MSRKILFERTLWQPAWWDWRTTVWNLDDGTFSIILMSMKAIGLEKISLLICKVLKPFFNALIKVQFQRTLWQARLVIGNKQCSNMENVTINSYWSLCRQLRWRKISLTEMQRVKNCFLTQWPAVTSIPFVIETIYSSHFRCDYLRNKKYFWNFSLHFEIYIKFWTFSKKRTTSSLIYFRNKDAEKGV